jgi:5'-nucleotidase
MHTQFLPDADVQVVFAHDKTLMHGDILIDDNPEISGKMVPSWKQILFDEDYLFSKHLNLPRINWSNYQEVLLREYEFWLQNKKALQ